MNRIKKLLVEYSDKLRSINRVKPLFDSEEHAEEFMEECKECLELERVELHTYLLISQIEEQLDPMHPIKHSNHFKALKKEHGLE